MNLIRNAIVYAAELPSAVDMRKHLAEMPFAEPLSNQISSSGFVNVDPMGELVVEVTDGYAFALRNDAKVIPSSAVQAEVKKRVAVVEERQGFKPGRSQTREIKEGVMAEFTSKALVRSSTIICFYDIKKNFLIVPTTSAAVADLVISSLVRCTGSVKTSTIHISDLKFGLTTRLKAWIDGDYQAFGGFDPCDSVTMKREKEKISISRQALEGSQEAIKEAMAAGFTVEQMRFHFGGSYSFGLTDGFRFKSIVAEGDIDQSEGATTEQDKFLHEASVQLLSLSRVLTALCTLFGYQPPVEEKEAA